MPGFDYKILIYSQSRYSITWDFPSIIILTKTEMAKCVNYDYNKK